MSELVGKVVRLRDQNGIHAIGLAIAFTDRPVYLVEDANHFRMIHNYCMTEEATLAEQVEYWRARAIAAESK